MKDMKRMDAFILGVFALLAATLAFLGVIFAPPCIYKPTVPGQYPLFVAGFSVSHVFTIIFLTVTGVLALLHALREN